MDYVDAIILINEFFICSFLCLPTFSSSVLW